MSWYEDVLIGFDVETTGLDVENDRIVTASYEIRKHEFILESKTIIINPGIDIPQAAIDIHGLSNEFVKAIDVYLQYFDAIVTKGSIESTHLQAVLSHIPAILSEHDDREVRYALHRPESAPGLGRAICGHVHKQWRVNGRHLNVGVDIFECPVHLYDVQRILRDELDYGRNTEGLISSLTPLEDEVIVK